MLKCDLNWAAYRKKRGVTFFQEIPDKLFISFIVVKSSDFHKLIEEKIGSVFLALQNEKLHPS